jgi:hypothetical protein
MKDDDKPLSPFARALAEMRFSKEQASYLRDLIGSVEAQIGVITDALQMLNQLLADNEAGTRTAYLLIVSQELRSRLANARIEAGRYQETSAAVYRIEAVH